MQQTSQIWSPAQLTAWLDVAQYLILPHRSLRSPHTARGQFAVRGLATKRNYSLEAIRLATRNELTTKQVKEVGCRTCGAKPQEPCRLVSGKSRTTLHRDRRLAAAECLELKELTAELAVLSKKQSHALQAAPFPKMLAEEKADYEKRRLRIGKLCELISKCKPT